MVDFNRNSLMLALINCRDKRYYQAIFACGTRESLEHISDLIFQEITDPMYYDNVAQVKKNSHKFRVSYKNGSTLDCICAAKDGARGYRANLMIVDDYVTDEIKECVLRPHEISYEMMSRNLAAIEEGE